MTPIAWPCSKAKPAMPREITVSQLNALIKLVLADTLPGTIHLVGEISNLTRRQPAGTST